MLFDNKNGDCEINRCTESLFRRTNVILKNHQHLAHFATKSKKQIISAFGTPYGVELLPGIGSKLRRAHRYLTETVCPKVRYDENGERKETLTSTDLYDDAGVRGLPEVYMKIRNRMIVKARQSKNELIRTIIGGLQEITQDDIRRMKANSGCSFRFKKDER
jgi:hypothetical protein